MDRTTPEFRAYNRERQKAWRERNPERSRAKSREHYQNRRQAVLDLLGAFCNRCGFNDSRALEIDHIVPVHHRTLGRREWSAEMSLVRCHPEQYQVLCANCHAIKTRTEDFK